MSNDPHYMIWEKARHFDGDNRAAAVAEYDCRALPGGFQHSQSISCLLGNIEMIGKIHRASRICTAIVCDDFILVCKLICQRQIKVSIPTSSRNQEQRLSASCHLIKERVAFGFDFPCRSVPHNAPPSHIKLSGLIQQDLSSFLESQPVEHFSITEGDRKADFLSSGGQSRSGHGAPNPGYRKKGRTAEAIRPNFLTAGFFFTALRSRARAPAFSSRRSCGRSGRRGSSRACPRPSGSRRASSRRRRRGP